MFKEMKGNQAKVKENKGMDGMGNKQKERKSKGEERKLRQKRI